MSPAREAFGQLRPLRHALVAPGCSILPVGRSRCFAVFWVQHELVPQEKPIMKCHSIGVAAFSQVVLLAACSSGPPPSTSIKVPDALKPNSAESLAMIVPAKGVQIYECRAAKDSAAYEWAFIAPAHIGKRLTAAAFWAL
jgi:hypothetical protein